ncbi:hypothetical protein B296_00001018 [Ensete ventricosum]|uniref:Uncharacterized protein n=1 Tax=Ensete ventricosum TaxID=4639 RepID=A0A427AZ21_ENSVE|nr:hypothetical protein B296_00001018 [Ensete ventricosum]
MWSSSSGGGKWFRSKTPLVDTIVVVVVITDTSTSYLKNLLSKTLSYHRGRNRTKRRTTEAREIQKEESERLKSNFRRSSLPLPPVPLLLFLFRPLSSLLRTVVSYCSCRDHCERKHHKNGKHKESFCLPPPPPRPAPAVTLPGKRDRRRSCAARWVADSALARPPRLRLLLSSALRALSRGDRDWNPD